MRKKIVIFSQFYKRTMVQQNDYRIIGNEIIQNIDIKKSRQETDMFLILKENAHKLIDSISDDTSFISVRLSVCELSNEFWVKFIKQLYEKKPEIQTSINYVGILTEEQKSTLKTYHPKIIIFDNTTEFAQAS